MARGRHAIWVVDDVDASRAETASAVRHAAPDLAVDELSSLDEADAQLERGAPSGLLLVGRLADGRSSAQWLREHRAALAPTYVVFLVVLPLDASLVRDAHELATFLLAKPLVPGDVQHAVQRARLGAQLRASPDALVGQLGTERRLSPKQETILRLTARGGRRDDIADALGMEPGTVKHHLRIALRRTHLLDGQEVCAMIVQQVERPLWDPPSPPTIKGPAPARPTTRGKKRDAG